MAVDVNWTYWSDHFAIYTNMESFHCTPEANVICLFYFNENIIKYSIKKRLPLGCACWDLPWPSTHCEDVALNPTMLPGFPHFVCSCYGLRDHRLIFSLPPKNKTERDACLSRSSSTLPSTIQKDLGARHCFVLLRSHPFPWQQHHQLRTNSRVRRKVESGASMNKWDLCRPTLWPAKEASVGSDWEGQAFGWRAEGLHSPAGGRGIRPSGSHQGWYQCRPAWRPEDRSDAT